MKKYKVYVDMDGVLAGFEEQVEIQFGLKMGDIPKGKMWAKIKEYNESVAPWFQTLPKRADADMLWEFVNDNFEDVEILTATGSTPKDAAQQKRNWIANHYGADVKVNTVGAATQKAIFANPRAILIDDRDKAIDPFRQAGGIGILHTDTVSTIQKLQPFLKRDEE